MVNQVHRFCLQGVNPLPYEIAAGFDRRVASTLVSPLQLKPDAHHYLDDLHAILSDRDYRRFIGGRPEREWVAGQIDEFCNDWRVPEEDDQYRRIMFVRNEARDKVVGIVGLQQCDFGPHSGREIVVAVHPDHRREGIASAAMDAIMVNAFERGEPGIFGRATADNHLSKGMMSKRQFMFLIERDGHWGAEELHVLLSPITAK